MYLPVCFVSPSVSGLLIVIPKKIEPKIKIIYAAIISSSSHRLVCLYILEMTITTFILVC